MSSSVAVANWFPLPLNLGRLFPSGEVVSQDRKTAAIPSRTACDFTTKAAPETIRLNDAPNRELATDALSEPSTDTLIERIQREDRDAFRILFRRYSRLVESVGYKILGTQAEAEDLVQDVFLYIWARCKFFKWAESHSMHNLVIRITYHRAFDRRRYLMSRLYWDPANGDEKRIDTFSREIQNTCKLADSIHKGRVLKSAFKRLTPKQQRVLSLYYYEGFSLREISEKIQDSMDNVKNYWVRGLARLRESVHINDWDRS